MEDSGRCFGDWRIRLAMWCIGGFNNYGCVVLEDLFRSFSSCAYINVWLVSACPVFSHCSLRLASFAARALFDKLSLTPKSTGRATATARRRSGKRVRRARRGSCNPDLLWPAGEASGGAELGHPFLMLANVLDTDRLGDLFERLLEISHGHLPRPAAGRRHHGGRDGGRPS